jgi:formylmethanofuran dehydrogenase subunit E
VIEGVSCSIPKRLLKEAVKFHGHLGVYLVLGLKAGLYANEVLGKNNFEMHACVDTEPFPPRSCFVDGIQVSTSCTMGKRNIELRNRPSLSVRFSRGERQLTLRAKPVLLEEFEGITSKDNSREVALSLIGKPIEDLFDISRNSSKS